MRKKDLSIFYVFLKKSFTMLCIVFLVSTIFSVMNVFVVADPPSSGDWIVTGTESYSNQTIVLDGNLIVESGGNLTFKNVTFELKCHYDGEYNITVNPGGKFYVLDGSVITSHFPSNAYSFFVQPNSTFRMSHNELHSAGWVIPTVEEHMGLIINSDDAVVENCLISNNGHSIFTNGDGVVIRNNNITENYEGIRIGGEVSIYNNSISENGAQGITIGGECSPSIYDNTIEYTSGTGILIANATPIIRNNTIIKNREGIHLYFRANPMILDNTIASNNDTGITIRDHSIGTIQGNIIEKNPTGISISEESNPTIQGNNIIANGNGIHCENSNPTIQNNNISQNNNVGISCSGHSNPTIQGNSIIQNHGAGIHCFSSDAIIQNNTITSNEHQGIRLDYSSSLIQYNTISLNRRCGIYADHSNATIQGNNITGHFPAFDWWGAGILCYNNSAGTIKENSITDNFNGITCFEYSSPSIEGNSIRNNDNVGVTCLNNSNPTIQGNTIKFNNAPGIWSDSSSPIISGNNITSNPWGIHLRAHSIGIIQNNFIANNSVGILLDERCNPLIKENIIQHNNQTGIFIDNDSNATIEGNDIMWNQRGISIIASSPIIQANKISHNSEFGVSFDKWSNSLVQGNLIEVNSDGIFFGEGQCTPSIFGNIIRYNLGNGIRSMDLSKPDIEKNDIYSNEGYGILINDPRVTVKTTDNYWGSASGPVQSLPDATDPEEVSSYVLYNPWLTEPILIVEIINPLSNEAVSATVTVSANVVARNSVQKVEFYLDGLRYTDFDSPYEWSWDTIQYAETSHTIWVVGYDVFGLENKVSRTVFVDNTPPTASIESPQSGITYYGMVYISVNVTDNKEVSSVRFKVDNSAWVVMTFKAETFWEYFFNTTTLSDGQHNLLVLALDKAGNPATESLTILTDNTPPSLTIQHPPSGITVGLTLTVMVQANDISNVSRVEFYLGNTLVSTVYTVPYQWAWDTTRYPNGVYTITVKAYDTIGNVKSKDITVTVNNFEVPWWQANFLAIMQVVIGLVGLVLGIVTIFWSRERKKKKKKEEMTNVSPQTNSSKQD